MQKKGFSATRQKIKNSMKNQYLQEFKNIVANVNLLENSQAAKVVNLFPTKHKLCGNKL
jgi:hypothetical protein